MFLASLHSLQDKGNEAAVFKSKSEFEKMKKVCNYLKLSPLFFLPQTPPVVLLLLLLLIEISVELKVGKTTLETKGKK